jgi:ABC-2 type transport system permease protein
MRRRTAASLVAGFGLVSYLVNTLGAVSKDLAAWRKLSIFYYYSRSQPLVDGMSWPDVFILLAVAAALFGLTPLVFQRQDLAERTGGFLALRLPWSRRPMGKPRLLGSVMAKSLRDASGAIVGWGCLLASYAFLALAILPSLTTVMNLDAMLQQLGPVIKTLVGEMFSMTTPEGLLRTVFFSMLPVMLAIFSIIEALGIVAGEEVARTMDIMMAHPVSRSRLIVERFAALTIGTILLSVVIVLALAVGVSANAPSLSFANVILATVNAIFPTLSLAALTLAATCLLPNGGGAGMVVALITVTSYLINNLAPLWKALQPLQKLSVFYWYNNSQPLNGMMRWGDSGLLALATVALIALAIWAFNRRDLATG